MNPIYIIVIPLLVAFFSITVKKAAPYLAVITTFGLSVYVFIMDMGIVHIGGYGIDYSITLSVNYYNLIGLALVNILMFVVVAINFKAYKKYATIFLITIAGLNGLLMTNDLFNLFVFMEIVAISGYLYTATHDQPEKTLSYIVQGTIGSVFYLLGLIILYGMLGTGHIATLDIGDIASYLASGNVYNVAIPLMFMIIGLGVEVKILPLNNWVKNILEQSNTLTAPMIGVVISTAFMFVFGRVIHLLYQPSETLNTIIVAMMVMSVLAGEAMAYESKQLRKLLAFSSIAQAGIVGMLAIYGFLGSLAIFVATIAVAKMIMFLIAALLSENGSDSFEDLKGVFKKCPLLGAAFSVAVLSTLGLPLFAGFIAKMDLLQNLFYADQILFPLSILIVTIIEAVYFIKILGIMWYGEYEGTLKISKPILLVSVLLAIALIVYGVTSDLTSFSDLVDSISWMEVS
jgi:NADH-quinone oxidoreductase subunit N